MCFYSRKFDFKPAEEDVRACKMLVVRKVNGIWWLYSPYQNLCYGKLFDKNREMVTEYGEMPREEPSTTFFREGYVITYGVLHSYHPAYAAYMDWYNLFPAIIPKGTLYMTNDKEMVSRALKITGIPRLKHLLRNATVVYGSAKFSYGHQDGDYVDTAGLVHNPNILSFKDKIDLIWNYFKYKLKGGK